MNRTAALVLAVVVALTSLLLVDCGGSKSKEAIASNDSQAAQPGLSTVSREQLPHLRIVPVRTTTWSIAICATGTVDWDTDHTTQAITQVNGPISRMLVDTGALVKAGGSSRNKEFA